MLITYNHAKFIARALDSILAQKTTFRFAIHVIDDCSTDGAQDIIRDYAARHPGVVKPFINKKNIGRKVTQKNFYRGFLTLDGDYMAILEGDDCWTSPDRLQAHIDFLDANPDYVACAHNVLKSYEDNAKPAELYITGEMKETHTIDDLISLRSFFHASSLTFRNVFRGRVPRYFRSPRSSDIFINIAHAQFGKIRYTPDIWSLYQVHAGGVFSSMSRTQGWMWNIDGLRAFNRWLGFRHFAQFTWSIYRYCDTLLMQGRAEDGLTPEKRAFYTRMRARYRRAEKAYRWARVLLARWIPAVRRADQETRLNLGCGPVRRLDYVNVDIRRDFDPDMTVDLERTPWPWATNSVSEVRLHRTLEYLGADRRTFDAVMGELYRVTRPGGRIYISAAHPRTDAFLDDPGCVRVVSPAVMRHYDAMNAFVPEAHLPRRMPPVDFEMVRGQVRLAEAYERQLTSGQISREDAVRLIETGNNVCTEFDIELVVHKPPRLRPLEPRMAEAAATPAATPPR